MYFEWRHLLWLLIMFRIRSMYRSPIPWVGVWQNQNVNNTIIIAMAINIDQLRIMNEKRRGGGNDSHTSVATDIHAKTRNSGKHYLVSPSHTCAINIAKCAWRCWPVSRFGNKGEGSSWLISLFFDPWVCFSMDSWVVSLMKKRMKQQTNNNEGEGHHQSGVWSQMPLYAQRRPALSRASM